jgi:hypothetical protein
LAQVLNSLLCLLSVPLGRLLAFRRSVLLFNLRRKKRHQDASIQAATLPLKQVSRKAFRMPSKANTCHAHLKAEEQAAGAAQRSFSLLGHRAHCSLLQHACCTHVRVLSEARQVL